MSYQATNNQEQMTSAHYHIYPIPFMPLYPKLANAYVPYQRFVSAFPLSEALEKGTLFPELYDPYVPENKKWGEVK
ncbi:spore coat associated protein CotJA [Serpentinicella sp. ANB-PHB4]|uniref:spore coat associated protein CotJA n=1 Tax=Serpentinicella sp. ANB-PHB4 TaxID=3074076 RepID=UPI0028611B78|nr:spore coat associated protein CotJA [Serpentinicella sp. ANB-PHB4]MDR5659028.1 spore coat associated protein CotJA [Serpentinicella sp. ANB-PHB4]